MVRALADLRGPRPDLGERGLQLRAGVAAVGEDVAQPQPADSAICTGAGAATGTEAGTRPARASTRAPTTDPPDGARPVTAVAKASPTGAWSLIDVHTELLAYRQRNLGGGFLGGHGADAMSL